VEHAVALGVAKVFSTGILKISVITDTDKQKYRIYPKFIGNTQKTFGQNLQKLVLFFMKS
jgi:hypothetical protein